VALVLVLVASHVVTWRAGVDRGRSDGAWAVLEAEQLIVQAARTKALSDSLRADLERIRAALPPRSRLAAHAPSSSSASAPPASADSARFR